MRIVVTGHEGYLGRHLCPVLCRFGDVAGFSLPYRDASEWEDALDAELEHRPDVIVHAATDRLQRHEQDSPEAERVFASNYHCTKKIAEWARSYGDETKLIFTSTCSSIYPFSFYTWAKRCSADLIMAMLNNYCVFNIFTIYGREDPNDNKQSPIQKLMSGNLPYCFEGWVRDYIHVNDVVRGIVHVIEGDIRGEYDLGTGVGISSKEMADIWKHHRPPTGKGPEGYHEVLVARQGKMLPGFETRVDIREWLDMQSKNFDIVGRMHNG